MSSEENVKLLGEYMRAVWDERNPRAVERFVSETYRRHGSPLLPPFDRAQQIDRLEALQSAFPDISIEVNDVVAADDRIAFLSTLTGTHTGEFMGIPATRRRVTVRLVDMIRVEGGRFVEQWGGPDMFDLLRQLGATLRAGSDP